MTSKESNEFIKKSHSRYNEIKLVYCPALGCEVHFNAKGFRHFSYDSKGIRRSREEIVRRLSLLPYVPGIISLAKTYFRRIEGDGYIDYAFVRKIYFDEKERPVIVVVRKTGNGCHFYLSVMDE